MVKKRLTPNARQHAPRVRGAAAQYEADTPSSSAPIQEIAAGEFKARCLAIMDELQERGGEYLITKRGVPVARLLPARVERRPLLGSMQGTVTVHGDIVGPLDEPWDALEGLDDER